MVITGYVLMCWISSNELTILVGTTNATCLLFTQKACVSCLADFNVFIIYYTFKTCQICSLSSLCSQFSYQRYIICKQPFFNEYNTCVLVNR
jgi:hypothetical protein